MRVGIIGAMEVEIELLKNHLEDSHLDEVAGMRFYQGTLEGTPVVVVQSGIGKVNAGICAQVLVDRYEITHLINTGVAGSLDPKLDIGDLVISIDCVHHDFNVTPLGFEPGEIPGMGTASFKADPDMRAAAVAAAEEVTTETAIVEGRVTSGDCFVAGDEMRNKITETFGGECCEMEGAAIAQTAVANKVPFVVVRAISDKPGTDDQLMDYRAFEAQAARNCAAIVAKMVGKLS